MKKKLFDLWQISSSRCQVFSKKWEFHLMEDESFSSESPAEVKLFLLLFLTGTETRDDIYSPHPQPHSWHLSVGRARWKVRKLWRAARFTLKRLKYHKGAKDTNLRQVLYVVCSDSNWTKESKLCYHYIEIFSLLAYVSVSGLMSWVGAFCVSSFGRWTTVSISLWRGWTDGTSGTTMKISPCRVTSDNV